MQHSLVCLEQQRWYRDPRYRSCIIPMGTAENCSITRAMPEIIVQLPGCHVLFRQITFMRDIRLESSKTF